MKTSALVVLLAAMTFLCGCNRETASEEAKRIAAERALEQAKEEAKRIAAEQVKGEAKRLANEILAKDAAATEKRTPDNKGPVREVARLEFLAVLKEQGVSDADAQQAWTAKEGEAKKRFIEAMVQKGAATAERAESLWLRGE